jgi:hypothetical protein
MLKQIVGFISIMLCLILAILAFTDQLLTPISAPHSTSSTLSTYTLSIPDVSYSQSSIGIVAPANGITTVYLPLLSRHSQTVSPQRLVWLPLDEPADAVQFKDKSGNQNTGRCTSSTCPQSGLYGKTGTFVYFDGIDDQIEIVDSTTLNTFGSGHFSLEAWVYLSAHSCGFCRLINKFDGNRGFSFDLADNTGNTKLTLYLNDGSTTAIIRGSQNLLINEWHHVAAVVSPHLQMVSLYIDGEEVEYERRDSLSSLGNLINSAPLQIGKFTGENNSFEGLMHDIAIYQEALTSADIQAHFQTAKPETTAWFARWYSGQVLTVFQGFGLEVDQPTMLTTQNDGVASQHAIESVQFSLPSSCADCKGWVFTFANNSDLELVRNYFESTVEATPYLYINHNALVMMDRNVPIDLATKYQEALEFGLTRSQLDAPTNQTKSDYASWDKYYPTNRGQQRDPQTGRSQRTFDRWEDDNQWLYGQSTWLYQDPNMSNAPPLALPASYQDQALAYYYHFHCEKERNPDLYKDCLNWQIYIELFGIGDDETELPVWARGGWSRLTPTTPQWEVYYDVNTFNGGCTTENVLNNASDALLLDPKVKSPLLFRMPSRVGAWHITDEVCTVIFNTYLYRLRDVQKAISWYAITYLHNETYDAHLERTYIKAENVYYEYMTTVNGEAVFKQWANEIYWVWEMKPEQPLLYGMDSFWWWSWTLPPEENRDTNLDPTWADLQWCYVDFSYGPEGLGTLICEPDTQIR